MNPRARHVAGITGNRLPGRFGVKTAKTTLSDCAGRGDSKPRQTINRRALRTLHMVHAVL